MSMTTASTEPTPNELLGHSRWLRALARTLVLDDSEADDLVQEAWLAVLSRPVPAVRNPRAWLAGLTRNLARRHGRVEKSRRAREKRVAQPEAQGPGDAEGIALLQRDLTDLVLALEEPYRSTILARYFEELPPREIARRDHLRLNTVKSRLARGLSKLRADLDTSHGDRRTWGMALLPLASRGSARSLVGLWSAGAIASGLIVAAILTGVAMGPSLDAPTDTSPAQVSMDESSTVRDAAGDPTAGPERHEVPKATEDADLGGTIVATVVDDATGAPVPHASLCYLDQAATQREAAAKAGLNYADVEAVLDLYGRKLRCNAKGEAEFRVRDGV